MNKSIKFLIIVVLLFLFCDKVKALNNIKIDNNFLSPYFDKNIHKYNYFTNSNKIVITVESEENEEVKGYGIFEIKDMENVFEIVSLKDNAEKKYYIHVFKNYKKNSVLSSKLKYLSIDGYNIDFNENKYYYDINIFDEDRLNINYLTYEDNARVIIKGNNNFSKEKNTIEIKVISSNNQESIYTIYANKSIPVFNEIKTEKSNYSLNDFQKKIVIICIIIISYILLSEVFKLLFTNRRRII